jgi:hypothetical protein
MFRLGKNSARCAEWKCIGLQGFRRIDGQLHGAQEAKTDMH